MDSTRILIVDDEPRLAFILSTSLEKIGNDNIVDIAHNGEDALSKLQKTSTPYNLLITDYNMPGMNGLELSQAVRQISPDTQVVLMTAYGTDRLRDKVGNMGLDGYLDKPFSIKKIREIVERAVKRTQDTSKPDLYRSGQQAIDDATQKHLNELHRYTHARCVLLISSSGFPVSTVGQTENLDITGVSALVAANFLASIELANMLGSNKSLFKSSYHEGNDYNIYSYDINGELLLAVIFGAESKPGMVWFFTKQAAAELEPLVADQFKQPVFATEDNIEASFDAELDNLFDTNDDDLFGANDNNLFDTGKETDNGLDLYGSKQDEFIIPDEFKAQLKKKTSSAKSLPFKPAISTDSNQDDLNVLDELKVQPDKNNVPPPKKNGSPTQPMTFEQAVAAGLVPSTIVNRERKTK